MGENDILTQKSNKGNVLDYTKPIIMGKHFGFALLALISIAAAGLLTQLPLKY